MSKDGEQRGMEVPGVPGHNIFFLDTTRLLVAWRAGEAPWESHTFQSSSPLGSPRTRAMWALMRRTKTGTY